MSEFKIEKNIPISGISNSKHSKYPFGQMEIGDSFFVDFKDRNRISSPASYFGIRNKGFKFSIKKEGEGFRVWRVPCDAKLTTTQEQILEEKAATQ